ncbi:MAG: hypothetical protein OXT09_31265 [Myxococcales bacterium]|nr:hypothetical protein [Myxococcales bacterium]
MRNSLYRTVHIGITAALLIALSLACACSQTALPPSATTTPADPPSGAIDVPRELERALLDRKLVAQSLNNPRGMHRLASGALLVAEAGTGDPDNPLTGALTELSDRNADGDYLDEGERRVLLADQPSKNILKIVRRDEVFGMAGIAEGKGQVLVARAFFGGPSHIFAIEGDATRPWGETHLNINDLAYDPPRDAWVGVASTTDEVVRLVPGGGVERILKLPPLPNGQDSVPGYLRHDPVTGKVLVSLFTGSPEGEEGGEGTELVPRAGGIIALDPATRSFTWAVTGLTVPTDFEIASDGSIYVLEFCDAFLDPVGTREAMYQGASHGGFKRFSGRLLRVDRKSGQVTIVAEGLDAPSNLALADGALYVAEGMGTPGRLIPAPGGVRKLTGYIERIELPAP